MPEQPPTVITILDRVDAVLDYLEKLRPETVEGAHIAAEVARLLNGRTA